MRIFMNRLRRKDGKDEDYILVTVVSDDGTATDNEIVRENHNMVEEFCNSHPRFDIHPSTIVEDTANAIMLQPFADMIYEED